MGTWNVSSMVWACRTVPSIPCGPGSLSSLRFMFICVYRSSFSRNLRGAHCRCRVHASLGGPSLHISTLSSASSCELLLPWPPWIFSCVLNWRGRWCSRSCPSYVRARRLSRRYVTSCGVHCIYFPSFRDVCFPPSGNHCSIHFILSLCSCLTLKANSSPCFSILTGFRSLPEVILSSDKSYNLTYLVVATGRLPLISLAMAGRLQ